MISMLQVEYLATNILSLKHFIIDWLEFSEKIGIMATEGELELWEKNIRNLINKMNLYKPACFKNKEDDYILMYFSSL